jgi:hypothetical protein
MFGSWRAIAACRRTLSVVVAPRRVVEVLSAALDVEPDRLQMGVGLHSDPYVPRRAGSQATGARAVWIAERLTIDGVDDREAVATELAPQRQLVAVHVHQLVGEAPPLAARMSSSMAVTPGVASHPRQPRRLER